MSKRSMVLAGIALIAMASATEGFGQGTNVGVDVDGDNVDIQIFVNEKPDHHQILPQGVFQDVTAGCFYREMGRDMPDEYASWSGACDEHGFITGEGRLTFIYPSGAPNTVIEYREGMFRDGQQNGFGRTHRLNGREIQGQFRDGIVSGDVEVIFANGAQYFGEWRRGMNGHGELLYPNGDHYVGRFRDSKRHGQGTFTKANGQHYIGAFEHDEAFGQGLLIQTNGECFEGQFYDGRTVPGTGRTWRCGL